MRRYISALALLRRTGNKSVFSTSHMKAPRRGSGVPLPGMLAWPPAPGPHT